MASFSFINPNGISQDLQSGSVLRLIGAAQKAGRNNTLIGADLRSIAVSEATALGVSALSAALPRLNNAAVTADILKAALPGGVRAVANAADGVIFLPTAPARQLGDVVTGAGGTSTLDISNAVQTPPGAPVVPASVTITATSTGTVVIKGPESLDRAAAQQIFDQQLASGSLIGLAPGAVISAATQVASGLVAAESQLLQQISQTPSQAEQITPARSIADILAKFPVTNGITVADYAKQPAETTGLGNMTAVQLTGVLAQVRKLTAQPATVVTAQGLGSYALTAAQLAAAGYIKPAVARLLQSGQNSLPNVLKSPAAWTGLNGATSLQQILSNEPLQQQIQINLMTVALNYLRQVGIAIDQFPARSQAGAILSAAKSPAAAEAWLQGQPTSASNSVLFSQYVRDGAYAVDFVAGKINNAMANEADPVGVTNATNRARLDAATNRIVGNPKVPQLVYGTEPVNPVLAAEYIQIRLALTTTQNLVDTVAAQTTTLQNSVLQQSRLESYRSTLTTLKNQVAALRQQASTATPISSALVAQLDLLLQQIDNQVIRVNNRIQLIQQVKAQLQRR
jgi:hypothetical protein